MIGPEALSVRAHCLLVATTPVTVMAAPVARGGGDSREDDPAIAPTTIDQQNANAPITAARRRCATSG
jgi:hypothetical protein